LKQFLSKGWPYDKPCPHAGTETIPINLAAQYERADNLTPVLAEVANRDYRPELLEAADKRGRSPAYLAAQKGNPEYLGIMAKAGANLNRECPVTWEMTSRNVNGNSFEHHLVDPDPERYPVHHALNQAVLSFATNTCCKCFKGVTAGVKLLGCSQCTVAYYCSKDCQKGNWANHKVVCKKIKRGSDLVTIHDAMPPPGAQSDSETFQPFHPWDAVIGD